MVGKSEGEKKNVPRGKTAAYREWRMKVGTRTSRNSVSLLQDKKQLEVFGRRLVINGWKASQRKKEGRLASDKKRLDRV